MHKILAFFVCWCCVVSGRSQTAQLNFVYKNGSSYGRWKVMDLPTSLFLPGVPQGQLLIFYPPAYTAGKLCGLCLWSGGDGEQNSLDISQVTANSLPLMVKNGLTPYSLLPTGDTLWHIVCAIHNNSGSAYRTQLAQIIPWILDKSGIRCDLNRVWATGLSGGGSATWASVMIDTTLSKRIKFIAPLANGGYDDKLPQLMGNLVTACKQGLYCWPYIGTQDPGYNASGFFAYDAVMKQWSLPDHYHPHIILNGTHSANVWDVPFLSRVFWDSLGLIGTPSATAPLKAKITIDSTVINPPNSLVHINGDSSTGNPISFQWLQVAGPTKAYWQSGAGTNMVISGLFPGNYLFELYVNNAVGLTDSAFVSVKVNPIPIAPQRHVSNITWTEGSPPHMLITYTDGFSEQF